MATRRHVNRSVKPKAEYIAIASRLFADHGFHGVSLSAVATEAGVTKQALLHFFGTKERLYSDVLDALAVRLVVDVESFASPDPIKHLSDYMSALVRIDTKTVQEARLVVHALLDSDPGAKHWPLKPYLDRMIELVRAVPGAEKMREVDALAWAFRIIGAFQYLAISIPTVDGMFGISARETLADQMRRFVDVTVADLSNGNLSSIAAQDHIKT